MIISHPDYDHIAGLEEVLRKSTVRQLWYSGYDSSELSAAWNKLEEQIAREPGLRYLSPLEDYLDIGSRVRLDILGTFKKGDDVVLTLINTKKEMERKAYGSGRSMDEGQRRNSSSIVVKLEFGTTSFLFTGDTNGEHRDTDSLTECDD